MQGHRECIGVAISSEAYLESVSMLFKSSLDLLARYDFLPTEEVANILPKELSIRKVLSSGDEGLVNLASAIIDREVQRTFFLGPLAVERPEHQLLLRQNNVVGGSLLFNWAVLQWIDHQRQEMARDRKRKTRAKNNGVHTGTVALVAHNPEKKRIVRFALEFQNELRCFSKLVATTGTRAAIMEALQKNTGTSPNLDIEVIGHGPLEGDTRLINAINGTPRSHPWFILFWVDHKHEPIIHLPDVLSLIRASTNPARQIMPLFNSHMAREWITRYNA